MKSSPVSKGGTIYEIVHEIRIQWKELLCIVDLFWIKDPNVSFKSHNHSPGQHPCVVFLICSSLFQNIGTLTISLGLSFHARHGCFGRQDDKVTQQIHTHKRFLSQVATTVVGGVVMKMARVAAVKWNNRYMRTTYIYWGNRCLCSIYAYTSLSLKQLHTWKLKMAVCKWGLEGCQDGSTVAVCVEFQCWTWWKIFNKA